MCFYADGLFLKRVKGTIILRTTSKHSWMKGHRLEQGPKSMQLINHFTFDGSDLMNVAPSKSPEATNGSVMGTSFTACGDGKFCLLRTQGGNNPQYKFKLKGRQSMKESAVMSWFSFNGAEGSIWSSVSEDGGDVDRSTCNQGYLHAKYYNEELKSSNALKEDEFAHVAMVLNKESGFSIYINGNRAHDQSQRRFSNPASRPGDM